MNALCMLSALDIARHVARRECSCVDVVDAHLQRIREANPHLNAIVHVMDEETRQYYNLEGLWASGHELELPPEVAPANASSN